MTNGLRPSMPRLAPAGSGGAGCAGRGMRKVVRACTTALAGCASRWPTSVLAPATPTATEPVIRNWRRPGWGGAGRGPGRTGPRTRRGVTGGRCRRGGAGAGGRRRRGGAGGGGTGLPGGGGADQPGHGECPGRGPDQDGQRVNQAGVRPGQRGPRPISVNTVSPASP